MFAADPWGGHGRYRPKRPVGDSRSATINFPASVPFALPAAFAVGEPSGHSACDDKFCRKWLAAMMAETRALSRGTLPIDEARCVPFRTLPRESVRARSTS